MSTASTSRGVAAGLVVLVGLGGRGLDLWPSWNNPVEQKVVDRSTPPLLLAPEDLSEYHAATGTFQVVIDQERDTRYVPLSSAASAPPSSLPAPSMLGPVRVDPEVAVTFGDAR